jgi:3-oxoadipate enol-lactonase
LPSLIVSSGGGARLHYAERGAGPETIVFSHGLLFTGEMFAAQTTELAPDYRCITYDHRGQGASEVTHGGYDMDTLTADAVELIEALEAGPCHFCGLSMGGFVGMRLAMQRPDLVRSLTLMETSADPEPRENVPRYRMLSLVARWLGIGLVTSRVLPIMFGSKFLNDPARHSERDAWITRIKAADRVGIMRATGGVIDRDGVHARLDTIACPTLVIVGDQDVATVPAKAERIHAGIAGSQLVVIPGAGHSSCVEEPDAVNDVLRRFLKNADGYTHALKPEGERR